MHRWMQAASPVSGGLIAVSEKAFVNHPNKEVHAHGSTATDFFCELAPEPLEKLFNGRFVIDDLKALNDPQPGILIFHQPALSWSNA